MRHLTTSALVLGLALGAGSILAECYIDAGSVRIVSDDTPALDAMIEVARERAKDMATDEARAALGMMASLAPYMAADSNIPDTEALSTLSADGKVLS